MTELPLRVANALHRLTALFRIEPVLTLELLAWRTVLPILKRTVAVPTLARWMWSAPEAALEEHERNNRLARVTRVVSAGRVVLSSNCLERSLILYRLLSRAGETPSVVLGIRRKEGQAVGHAWVSVDAVPLGDLDAYDYSPIAVIGARGVCSP